MTKLPIKKLKSGLITISIWQNEEGLKSYTLQKAYKEKDSEEWKYTQSFNLDDLPKVKLLIEEAYKISLLK